MFKNTMSGISKLISVFFCAALFALCLWLSKNILLAPFNPLDRGIAMVCDFAGPKDADRLEKLSERIFSPWWRDYAKSRLKGKLEGTTEEIAKKIFTEFRAPEFRAYLLATQSLHTPELTNYFQLLPERDSEFAYLIYAVLKGMKIDANAFLGFKKTYLANSGERLRRHYGDVLLTQAFKTMNVAAADMIFSSLEYNDNFSWTWFFVMNGANPDNFTTLDSHERKSLTALYNSKNQKPSLSTAEMLNTGKKISMYSILRIRDWSEALWAAGAKEDSLFLLRRIYSGVGMGSGVLSIRTSALKVAVQSLGAKGLTDHACEYIFANAGNLDLLHGLVAETSISAAGMGHMEKSTELLDLFTRLKGRINAAFHIPSSPAAKFN